MMNLIKIVAVAGVIFGAAAGGSWFLQKRSQTAGAKTESGHEDAAAGHGHGSDHDDESPKADASGHGHDGAPKVADGHSAPGADSTHDAGHGGHSAGGHGADAVAFKQATVLTPENGLPATVRPRPVSVEELLRYSLGLKNREEAIIVRERDMERRQAQVNIALADIQGEQQELDGLRTQVQEQLATVKDMLDRVASQKDQLDTKRTEAEAELKKHESLQKDVDVSQQANVKRMSTWFQSMEPEKAASVLRQFAKEGKMDLAVQLLSNFEEREAAKILSAIDDTTLTVEIAEAFQTSRRPSKKDEVKR